MNNQLIINLSRITILDLIIIAMLSDEVAKNIRVLIRRIINIRKKNKGWEEDRKQLILDMFRFSFTYLFVWNFKMDLVNGKVVWIDTLVITLIAYLGLPYLKKIFRKLQTVYKKIK